MDKKVRWAVVVRVQLHLRSRVCKRVRKREREERKRRGGEGNEAKVEDL